MARAMDSPTTQVHKLGMVKSSQPLFQLVHRFALLCWGYKGLAVPTPAPWSNPIQRLQQAQVGQVTSDPGQKRRAEHVPELTAP